MNGFKRTTSGLNNQHLFYNVDIVAFVEGGSTSYNLNEVYDGKYSEETEDSIFWHNIFRKFRENKKVKVKSVGSKSTIKEIAIDIIEGKLTSVFVCMDSEFDDMLGKKIHHPNVYYTYGYSYENDVWNELIIKSVIEELTAVEIANTEIEQVFSDFLQKIKLGVFADAYMFKKESSFFPRKTGYLFCVDCTPKYLPSAKAIEIQKRLDALGLKKSTLYAFGRRQLIDVKQQCFGHLLADYCCQVIIHYIKKRHYLTAISKNIIYRIGIKKFFENFEDSVVSKYYYAQFQKTA